MGKRSEGEILTCRTLSCSSLLFSRASIGCRSGNADNESNKSGNFYILKLICGVGAGFCSIGLGPYEEIPTGLFKYSDDSPTQLVLRSFVAGSELQLNMLRAVGRLRGLAISYSIGKILRSLWDWMQYHLNCSEKTRNCCHLRDLATNCKSLHIGTLNSSRLSSISLLRKE